VRRFRVALAVSGGAALALAAALSPAIGASSDSKVKPRVSLSARGGLGSFTPALADPRLSALLSRGGLASSGFRFTPAATSVRLNRSVTVAVRASLGGSQPANDRAQLVAPTATGFAPIAYNLGVAVGWKRFALSSDVAKVDLGGAFGGREAVDVGVSYSIPKLTTRVAVGADQATRDTPRALAEGKAYSVAMSGSYSLTRNIDLTAGVKYRATDRDRVQTPLADARRDNQAVYIGTAFKF